MNHCGFLSLRISPKLSTILVVNIFKKESKFQTSIQHGIRLVHVVSGSKVAAQILVTKWKFSRVQRDENNKISLEDSSTR